jgi:hypothetical protein
MKDPIIAELRKIRDAHAAKFNNDFDAIARDWMKEEAAARRAGQKFVDLSAKRKPHPRCRPVVVTSNKGRSKS